LTCRHSKTCRPPLFSTEHQSRQWHLYLLVFVNLIFFSILTTWVAYNACMHENVLRADPGLVG
jgi:hypothetical protein